MKQSRGTAGWVGLIAVGAIAEAEALRSHKHERTLSHATRTVFFMDHPVGKAVFIMGWAGLTYWLLPHLLKCPETSDGPSEMYVPQTQR